MALGLKMRKVLESIDAQKDEIIAEREHLNRFKKRRGKTYAGNALMMPRGNVLLSMGHITTAEDTEKAIDRIAKNRTTARKELKKWNSKFIW
ncbi:hypothetical protein FACS1894133_6540 [Clostridia bacterium]|nr:hypothetical protein FACS1894133_6540 [Clostridia bacterium]